ncbi:ABC transporter ATP-binding protein [Nitrospira tepida]|uniref:ABC transporter ATP-binding protein n=1 Tax=Nitrospira tepida TaxID=2973512 RepID=A0AA86N3G9_9BACT|nr:ATP-binding cassette domain-containing protein [Nitrospira tepida]CAI4033954.1 ABC transporter ATP-binding protein [Nitrospira tepida]
MIQADSSAAVAASPIIEVSHVSTRFGTAVVHRDVSLSVRPGEIFAIAGGSGCGKSVLMREIIGLHRPTSGTVRLFGLDSATYRAGRAPALYQRFGVMFQQGALFSSLTLEDNVAVPLREFTSLSERLIRDIVAVKLAAVGLPMDSGPKYPAELSGGMRKRGALARAIAMDPELLFLDEPTSGLDPMSSAGIDELILNLKSLLGLTVVMVTHDLDLLWRVADRVAVIGDGRVLGIGTMAELSRSEEPGVKQYFHGPRGRGAAAKHAWNPESNT